MKVFIIIILMAACGGWVYLNYGQGHAVEMQLSNVNGKEIDIILLSRSANHVRFQRSQDGQQFRYPLEELSFISKCKVYWYLRETAGAGGGAEGGTGGGSFDDERFRSSTNRP